MFLTNYTAFKESLKVCAAGTRESGRSNNGRESSCTADRLEVRVECYRTGMTTLNFHLRACVLDTCHDQKKRKFNVATFYTVIT